MDGPIQRVWRIVATGSAFALVGIGVTLGDELRIARDAIGLTSGQIERCLENASNHTFLPGAATGSG